MNTNDNTLSAGDFDRITADVIASAQRVDKLFQPLQRDKQDLGQAMHRLHNDWLEIENETLKEN